jgi:nitrite reductase (NADH) small subunit
MQDYCLGPVSRIPIGEGREFCVEGLSIAIFRSRNGEVYAAQALCPHREGPLADGLLGGSVLACPLHAIKFDLATGKALNEECGLTTYPVRLNFDHEIVLTLSILACE